MGQGQNSKQDELFLWEKKASTTYASTSKKLSRSYLNPYIEIDFLKVRLSSTYKKKNIQINYQRVKLYFSYLS